jgi:DNA-binding transcriptional ArsR family regulator
LAPSPLPDELVELIAERFRALGEPTRIKLLDTLRESEASVQQLADTVGSSQQNVSKHLGVLYGAGIVGRRREGNYVRYWIADEGVLALCEDVCGSLRQRLDSLHQVLTGVAG